TPTQRRTDRSAVSCAPSGSSSVSSSDCSRAATSQSYPLVCERRCRTRTSGPQIPVAHSRSSSSSASAAVNGFVIDATWKRVPGSHPTAAVSTLPSSEIPRASAGTSQASAAASEAWKNAESSTSSLPYCSTRSRPSASSFAADLDRRADGPGDTSDERRRMPLTKEEKLENVQKFGKHATDTGWPEVPSAMLRRGT